MLIHYRSAADGRHERRNLSVGFPARRNRPRLHQRRHTLDPVEPAPWAFAGIADLGGTEAHGVRKRPARWPQTPTPHGDRSAAIALPCRWTAALCFGSPVTAGRQSADDAVGAAPGTRSRPPRHSRRETRKPWLSPHGPCPEPHREQAEAGTPVNAACVRVLSREADCTVGWIPTYVKRSALISDSRRHQSSRGTTRSLLSGTSCSHILFTDCMSPQKPSVRERRISDYQALLVKLSRESLPWQCDTPIEIEHLLALHGASLVVAEFVAPVFARDGSRSIPNAVVKSLTPEGRLVVRSAALRAPTAGWHRSEAASRRAMKVSR